jgi:hypothetical protein
MRETHSGNASVKKLSTPLRYLPAALVSGFLLALLLFSPGASDWAKPWFYGMFSKAKGAPPVSHSVVIVSADPENGVFDRGSIGVLAKAILQLRPKVLAVNLPSRLPSDSDMIQRLPPEGNVVLAHGFRSFQPWTFSETATQAYPNMVSRSLYPQLDLPGNGLELPMGIGMEISDSLLKWPSPSTGFSWPIGKKNVYAIPAFARLGRGVVANLGVEAARRSLGIPIERVRYLDGVGVLFNAEHILPVDGQGQMFLRLHARKDIPRITTASLLAGTVSPDEVEGKIVFLDAVDPESPGIPTVSGPRSTTEILAEAALGFSENSLVTLPSWAGSLSVTLGIVLAGLIIAALVLECSTATAWILAFLLASLYPFIAFVVFMKSSTWLPPGLPMLMVLAGCLPFSAMRLLFPVVPATRPYSRKILPVAAFDPVLVSGGQTGNRQGILGSGPTVTPLRGIPITTSPSPKPIEPAPVQVARPGVLPPKEQVSLPVSAATPVTPVPSFSDPRDPPILRDPGLGPIPSTSPRPAHEAPRHAHPASTAPASLAPQNIDPGGSGQDDIERDAKGGLIRLGKYRIVRKMGSGSAGDVFEGFDTKMGRQVAIKTITKNANSLFDRAAERFVIEAKSAGSLNHPCINTVYDFGSIRNTAFIVLEYLDGLNLSQWMKNHPIPPHPITVAPWIEQLCSAMDYAHSHKVIHRDLKPANLMIVNNGATIKLLDFGIAKMEDVGLTQTGMTVGTPSHMSPEQLNGVKVTAQSDQYALAVVIYQLLTYKLPYVGSKIPELCNRIITNDLVPITEINPSLGQPFWEALRKAMAKNPENRYANCTEMYLALKAVFPENSV